MFVVTKERKVSDAQMFREEIPYEEIQIKYTKENWEIGFGLQAIDGLKPSKYLVDLAGKQVTGKMSYEEVETNLKQYYEEGAQPEDNMEADFSSMRIAEILANQSFTFSPVTLLGYHRKLFSGIETFHHPVGEFRKLNITKKEPVLAGASVLYTDFGMIKDTLTWDFDQEKSKDYQGKAMEEIAHEVMSFISSIWQIHPFREGNTRTIAVFAIKYLNTFGFELNNEPFKNHSKYFRDSLALANANRMIRTEKYLRMFTENILLGGVNKLLIRRD